MKQLSENEAYENFYQFIGSTKYRKNLFYDNAIRAEEIVIMDIVMQFH